MPHSPCFSSGPEGIIQMKVSLRKVRIILRINPVIILNNLYFFYLIKKFNA